MTPLLISLRQSLPAFLAAISLCSICSCTLDQGAAGSGAKKSTAPSPSSNPGSYKKAYRTENPNHVISPFPPHNLIDISKNPKTGEPFKKGDFAKDPSNGQIFRIP